ncbi:MAG: DUF4013 domain-containing protein [Anaerolineae bacterium]|nr:DUF4013 domain-containing protein [Anaerolineae bacterium]
MDIGKSFTYVFDDEEWVSKLLIAAVLSFLSFLIVPAIIITGYMVGIVRNVRRGDPRPLPKWENLGDMFRDGLMLLVAFLVYSLPLLVILCPIIVIAIATGDSQSAQDTLSVLSVCFTCLAVLWGIVLALVSPALYIRYAETNELSALFRFGDIVSFTTSNIGPVIVVIVVGWVASLIASIVGLLLCGIGLVVTTPWATLVMAHLYAQVGMKPQAPPAPPAPPTPSEPPTAAPPPPSAPDAMVSSI